MGMANNACMLWIVGFFVLFGSNESKLRPEDITTPIEIPPQLQPVVSPDIPLQRSNDHIIFKAHTINATSFGNLQSKNYKFKNSIRKSSNNFDMIPTPSTCFDNDYDFYVCCVDGTAKGITCWEGNRTSTLCCQSQSLVILSFYLFYHFCY